MAQTKKVNQLKKRMFMVTQRADILTEEAIIGALDKNTTEKWAYILHDSDINEDSTKAHDHWHVVIYAKNATTISAIAKWFGVEEQYVEFVKSKFYADALIYLTHRLSPEKYEYMDDMVKFKKGYNWIEERDQRLKFRRENPNTREVEALIEKALHGEIRAYMLGSDVLPAIVYNRNQSRFDRAFKTYLQHEAPKEGIRRKIYFVTGDSGLGKTAFAMKYAKDVLQLNYFMSGTNQDPFQGYDGSPVLIVDDFRGDNMSVSDLLKMMEHTGKASGKARYADAGLSAVEHMIITFPSTGYKAPAPKAMNEIIGMPQELKMFFSGFEGHHREPMRQFNRRLNYFMRVVLGGNAYVYVRIDDDEWELIGDVVNTDPVNELARYDEDKTYMMKVLAGDV